MPTYIGFRLFFLEKGLSNEVCCFIFIIFYMNKDTPQYCSRQLSKSWAEVIKIILIPIGKTRRLLEYLPALNSIIESSPTFIVDEIERSIHLLIIKEIIEKFSKVQLTKGQLIFSTHESNLLDQEIFTTDEICFTEKNILGATKTG